MKNKPKGFGKVHDYKSIEQGLQKLSHQSEQEVTKLESILATPSGRGEIDAFLDREPRSEDLQYKAAYDKAQVAKLLADPKELAVLKSMQPFVEEILDSLF
jgi:hypothetical protein